MSDIDMFRHMSYANYIKLLFLASDACLLNLTSEFLDVMRIKVIKTEMNFKYQTKLGDHILIRVNTSVLRKSSFDLLYNFTLENSEQKIGSGKQSFILESLAGGEMIMPESLNAMLGQIQSGNILIEKYE